VREVAQKRQRRVGRRDLATMGWAIEGEKLVLNDASLSTKYRFHTEIALGN
jgi:hypothetical protein